MFIHLLITMISMKNEVTEVTKPITGVGSLALVAKKEIMKLKKSNEKVIVAHYSSNAINDECISDEKALIFRNGGSSTSKNGGLGYKGGNAFSDKNKSDGANSNQQQEEEQKEKKLHGKLGYDYNFCNGKHHFVKDYVLRKRGE
uniref:Uncharacterized protein n=1 Tax=Lactuca sativa TaxID=4236 RepID=A0A9R1XTP9_LACSA|nr:hypothetical protein LSAT_V11C300145830 [Lactuca sativa]